MTAAPSAQLVFARELTSAGISVVPPLDDGSKAPLFERAPADCDHPDCVATRAAGKPSWKHWQHAIADESVLARWYSNGRESIGVVCGSASRAGLIGDRHLEMFELEGRAVEAGLLDRLREHCDDHGIGDLLDELITGWSETTPSGGIHLYYYATGPLGPARKLAFNADGQVLIETKGEGGYSICAPTAGRYHASGNAWEPYKGGPATIKTITADERELLHACSRLLDDRPEPPPPAPPPPRSTSPRTGRGWMDETIADYNARTTWAEVLAGRFDLLTTRGAVSSWRYIGQSGPMGATTNAKGTDRLVVFSGTAAGAGFQTHDDAGGGPTTSYDRFSAHVVLTTGRNDTATRVDVAKRLQREGYGPAFDDGSKVAAYMEGLPAGSRDQAGANSAAAVATAPAASAIGRLPADFWDAAPELRHIQQAAHARTMSPEAVLVAVLTRVVATSPHVIELPAIVATPVGLSLLAGLVGGPSVGKSGATGVARELLSAPSWLKMRDGRPPGTGEGLIEMLISEKTELDEAGKKVKVRYQEFNNAQIEIDEGQVLTDLGARSGSTLLPTLRSMFTHATLGQSNASKERNRVVEGTSYVYGIVMALQPDKAAPLLSDAGGGTPQRFVWASAHAPRPPDVDDPGPLDWEPLTVTEALSKYPVNDRNGYRRCTIDVAAPIRHQVREDHIAALEGTSALPEHYNLRRLKVAAALALLTRREPAITVADWELAGAITDASAEVLASMHAHLANVDYQAREASTRAHISRATRAAVAVADTEQERALVSATRSVARSVHKHRHDHPEGGCDRGCVARSMASKHRQLVPIDDVIAAAIEHGWVTEVGGRIHPTESRPS